MNGEPGIYSARYLRPDATYAERDERTDHVFLAGGEQLDDGRAREAEPLASRRWTLEAGTWTQVLLALVEAL